MLLRFRPSLLLFAFAAAALAGCETTVHTDAPPPARVEVETKPAAPATTVDVDVKPPASGGVNVEVNKSP